MVAASLTALVVGKATLWTPAFGILSESGSSLGVIRVGQFLDRKGYAALAESWLADGIFDPGQVLYHPTRHTLRGWI